MNNLNFDDIIRSQINNEMITVGYIRGNNNVLFIKTGQDGSIYGYENKYINIAKRINKEYGCTIFVSTTSSDKKEYYDAEMQIVSNAFSNGEYNIYYFGVSKGGLIGCWYGADNPKLKRIVSVNAPLMINFFNKTKPALEKLKSNKAVMVYGEFDPSFNYTSFLKDIVNYNIVNGADHHFKDKSAEFESIIDEYLLFDL